MGVNFYKVLHIHISGIRKGKVSTVYKKKINGIKTTIHVKKNQDSQSLSIFFAASLTFLGIGCSSLIPKMYR